MNKKLIAGALPIMFSAFMGIGMVTADHAGEKLELSKAEGVTDGETITLTFSNLLKPGETTAQIIMANTFPVQGPDAFNLEEFGAIPPVPVAADGTGTAEFVAKIDHGTYDCLEIQCYVIVFQGIGLDSYTAGAPIKFADGAAPVATEPAATVPDETTPVTEAVVVTDPPATDPPATEPAVIAPAPTEAPEATVVAVATPAAKEDEGSNTGAIIGIGAVALAAIGAGGYMMNKKKGAKG